ncbi:MAG TPA: UPF0149 family protein [Casimicrobiaceae bacterium]
MRDNPAMATVKPLNAAELERLSAALASDALPEALPLDAVQGAFYAMASAPAAFAPADAWLPMLLGDNVQWQDAAQRADIESLLQRFANESRRDVQESEDSLPLLLFDDDAGKPDYATWCQGYLDGVDMSEPSWVAHADDDTVRGLLLPVEVLAQSSDEPPTQVDGIDDLAAFTRDAREDFAGVLLDIRHFWFDRRTSRVPATRETPKVGRNDACPCGSGRKFKQCHGAA